MRYQTMRKRHLWLALSAFACLLLGALPFRTGAAGVVVQHRLTSAILAAAGEVAEREVSVYVPDGYAGGATTYPTVYLLHGATGNNRTFLGAGYPGNMQGVDVAQIADQLIAGGKLRPLIIVLPDMSRAWGHPLPPYDGYLAEEVLPFVDRTYRTLASRDSRAITGHSEGGHGALHIAFAHADLFSLVGAYSAGSPGGPLPDRGEIEAHDQAAYPLSFWLYVGKNDSFHMIPSLNQELAGLIKAQGLPLVYSSDQGDHFNHVAERLGESLTFFSERLKFDADDVGSAPGR